MKQVVVPNLFSGTVSRQGERTILDNEGGVRGKPTPGHWKMDTYPVVGALASIYCCHGLADDATNLSPPLFFNVEQILRKKN